LRHAGHPSTQPRWIQRSFGLSPTRPPSKRKPTNTSQTRTQNPAAPTADGPTKYVAVAGDTVSGLAHRFLGSNNKANLAAIIALNPSLQQNPNNVTIGKTYLIPRRTKS